MQRNYEMHLMMPNAELRTSEKKVKKNPKFSVTDLSAFLNTDKGKLIGQRFNIGIISYTQSRHCNPAPSVSKWSLRQQFLELF